MTRRPKDYRPYLALLLFLGVAMIVLNGLRDPNIKRWLRQVAAVRERTENIAGSSHSPQRFHSGVLAMTDAPKPPHGPAGPKEMFQSLGVDAAMFQKFADGKAVDAKELEPTLRMLFRLRMFPAVQMQRWALDAEKLDDAKSLPKLRGELFRLHGKAVAIKPLKPSSDDAQRYEMPIYFEVHLQLDSGRTAVVYTEHVPPSWAAGAKPDATSGALGVFLKTGEASDNVFIAPRVAWYTDDLLGRLGMDFGLLEEVKNRTDAQRKVLESEPFYSLLAAVGRAESDQLFRQAEADFSKVPQRWRWRMFDGEERYGVAPLFNETKTQLGRLVLLKGAARRIKEVRVTDPEIVARFGVDHYYQVSLYTDDAKSYDEKAAASKSCPVTFCVLELPEGMPYDDAPDYCESVSIAGYFFKTWSYHVPKLVDPKLNNNLNIQWSPLLVGRALIWHPTPKQADTKTSAIVLGVVGFLLMVIIWYTAWRFRRQEKSILDREPPMPNFDKIAEMDKRKRG